MKTAIWIRELDWPERWVQADIIKRNTGRDGVPTITARRGSALMVRHESDHGSLWWYFDEKRLDELTGRTDYDAFGAFRPASEMGRKGGKASAAKLTPEERKARSRRGGIASAKALTPEQRKARAKKAVAARWAKLPSPRAR